MATLAALRRTVIPRYLDPVPSLFSLRRWFARAKLRSIKMNPLARRGGGVLYYNVNAVERYLRERTGLND